MTRREAQRAVKLLEDRCTLISINRHDNDDGSLNTHSVQCEWRDGSGVRRFYSWDEVAEHVATRGGV